MNIFQVVMISVVEGITEFLPISSTGHMILTAELLGVTESEFLKSFEIIIQLGAILAVLNVSLRNFPINRRSLVRILISLLPTVITGLLFYEMIKTYLLENALLTLLALFCGGIIMIIFEKIQAKKEFTGIGALTMRQALLIGIAQSFSVIPGVSRAAATIIGSMTIGLSRTDAVLYSFALAVPTMTAATALDLFRTGFAFSLMEYFQLSLGFGVAYLTAYVTVRKFLKYVKSNNLIPFGVYRIIIALALIPFVLR